MIRFNYGQNLLITKDGNYSLDKLRDYLMLHSEGLCAEHKIGCYFKPGSDVKDTAYLCDGVVVKRREISRTGVMVNTYDWDHIFFKANRAGLVKEFIIYENTSNRGGST